MALPWLIGALGGALFGGLLAKFGPKLFKTWNKLDDNTKKQIIEKIINEYKEILRIYYCWKKQKGDDK